MEYDKIAKNLLYTMFTITITIGVVFATHTIYPIQTKLITNTLRIVLCF